MPTKKSVQHLKRKSRLSGKDLKKLARKKCWSASVKYNFGQKGIEGQKIGWYLHNPRKSAVFIGANWVDAHNFILHMPTDSILQKYVPSCLGGAL